MPNANRRMWSVAIRMSRSDSSRRRRQEGAYSGTALRRSEHVVPFSPLTQALSPLRPLRGEGDPKL